MRQLGLLPAVVVLAALASGTARRCATEYAVKVRGGDEVAGTMANECGCTVLGKVGGGARMILCIIGLYVYKLCRSLAFITFAALNCRQPWRGVRA